MQADRLAWRVEETCLKAFPALRQATVGDWLLRFAGGVSRRANCANPRHARPGAGEDVVAACGALFRGEGLPVIFRIPSLVDAGIDRLLERLGYAAEGETLTLHGSLDGVDARPDPAVELLPRPGPEWVAAMARQQGYQREKAVTYGRIVGSIEVATAFAALRRDGALAALAFGAIHDGLLCFESVVTAAEHRGRGYGRRVLAALIAWGAGGGARGMCLQVQADNAPAIALYRSLGLNTELYRYHYRREPAAP